MINFNNGVPDEKEQVLVEQKIKEKFGGTTNAGKFVVAFNDNKESAATIETLQLAEAHAQYEFLSTESTQKIRLVLWFYILPVVVVVVSAYLTFIVCLLSS